MNLFDKIKSFFGVDVVAEKISELNSIDLSLEANNEIRKSLASEYTQQTSFYQKRTTQNTEVSQNIEERYLRFLTTYSDDLKKAHSEFNELTKKREKLLKQPELKRTNELNKLTKAIETVKNSNLPNKKEIIQKLISKSVSPEINHEPTEAQKEAGNYKKKKITVRGLPITLENLEGSTRRGKNKSGEGWEVKMNNDYGYINGTKGKDGDQIDVFLSKQPDQGKIYIIDQTDQDGSFDEHKVMIGFDSENEAVEEYKKNYNEGFANFKYVTEVDDERFKKWLSLGKNITKRKPFVELIKPESPIESIKNNLSEALKNKKPDTDKIGEIMKSFKAGELLNSEGEAITDRKQVLKILLSESGLMKSEIKKQLNIE